MHSLKHAYLIMVHKNTAVLKTLLQMLDHKDNDIYIHVDAKSNDNFDDLYEALQESKLYFTKRNKVYWGHISQIKTEYTLWEAAAKNGPYLYYHLLSGVDLPIKTQTEIHEFFKKNQGKEFIGFAKKIPYDKYYYWHIYPKIRNYESWLSTKIIRFQQKNNIINPFFKEYEIKKGSNWCSITHDFVLELLRQKKKVLFWLHYTNCPDECFVQTVAYNSSFRERIYDIENEWNGSMRLIDWERGKPYVFKSHDYNEILNSDKLFCRKIEDLNLAIAIKNTIEKINNEKNSLH